MSGFIYNRQHRSHALNRAETHRTQNGLSLPSQVVLQILSLQILSAPTQPKEKKAGKAESQGHECDCGAWKNCAECLMAALRRVWFLRGHPWGIRSAGG